MMMGMSRMRKAIGKAMEGVGGTRTIYPITIRNADGLGS